MKIYIRSVRHIKAFIFFFETTIKKELNGALFLPSKYSCAPYTLTIAH